jgi:YbdK family carboxylate-amine ligase
VHARLNHQPTPRAGQPVTSSSDVPSVHWSRAWIVRSTRPDAVGRPPGAPRAAAPTVVPVEPGSGSGPVLPGPPPQPVPAGATFGIEEEFHLVDPATFELTPSPELSAAALRGEIGPRIHAEIVTTQLETVSGVCESLDSLRAEVVTARREAARAAASAGVAVLPTSTHPFDGWLQQVITAAPRYRAIVDRWASLASQQDICGCHVHVGVPDLETAVAVMDRARPYLPVLLAMTGSSPFHDGVDTGYESYRTLWWGRWPNTGPPEYLGSAQRFEEVVAGMIASGVIGDRSHLYWDVRPSYHFPTLEFRLADVCTDVDDAVLHAALVRSLVRVLAARAEGGEPCPQPRPELLRAARWRAARDGIGGQLFDPVSCSLVDAPLAVGGLLAELEDDLRSRDEWAEVSDLVARLFARGTSATRQRQIWLRTGDRREVAAGMVAAGVPGGT